MSRTQKQMEDYCDRADKYITIFVSATLTIVGCSVIMIIIAVLT